MAKQSLMTAKEKRSDSAKDWGVKRKFATSRKGEEMVKSLLLAHRVTA